MYLEKRLSSDASRVYVWFVQQLAIAESWCTQGNANGPTNPGGAISLEVWEELQRLNTADNEAEKFVYGGVVYDCCFLDAQVKGDGRGAMGNIQLFAKGAGARRDRLRMNLHIQIRRPQKIVDLGDGWSQVVKPRKIKSKKKK